VARDFTGRISERESDDPALKRSDRRHALRRYLRCRPDKAFLRIGNENPQLLTQRHRHEAGIEIKGAQLRVRINDFLHFQGDDDGAFDGRECFGRQCLHISSALVK
jgi:hypothetical protein